MGRTTVSIVFAFAALFFFVTPGAAEQAHVLPAAEKIVLRVSERGLSPDTLTLRKLDSSVFIFNDTRSSLLTLEIPFDRRRVHCATANLQYGADNIARSTKPISPDDFALLCFPDSGDYSIKIFGLAKFPKGLNGTIRVAP